MALESNKLDLDKFDLLLYDVTSRNISNHPQFLNVKNLSLTDETPSFPVTGSMYMFCIRSYIPLICQFKNNPPLKIIFVIVTSSPFTFISKESIMVLTNSKPEEFDHKISIHGYDTQVLTSPEKSNFSQANVLGCDYLSNIKAILELDYNHYKVKISK